MSINFKFILTIGVMCFNTVLYAGAMGKHSTFSGFYVGAGGGYIYTTVNGSTDIKISTVPVVDTSTVITALTNHMAPVLTAGYFYDSHKNWLLGVKGFYKYIGVNEFSDFWVGAFPSTNASQSAAISTKLTQDGALFFTGGYQFDNWLLYAGAGPGAANTRVKLNGQLITVGAPYALTSTIEKTKTLWGGAGQVGAQYLLPNRLSIDLSYNFLATQLGSLPTIYFLSVPSSQYSSVSQRVHVVEQGFNITLNKYFG